MANNMLALTIKQPNVLAAFDEGQAKKQNNVVGNLLADGNVGGARENALRAGRFDLAGMIDQQVSLMSEQDAKRFQQGVDLAVAIRQQVKDPRQAAQMISSRIPGLDQDDLGFLAGAELGVLEQLALGTGKSIEQRFKTQEREAGQQFETQERIAGQNFQAGQKQLDRDARVASGGLEFIGPDGTVIRVAGPGRSASQAADSQIRENAGQGKAGEQILNQLDRAAQLVDIADTGLLAGARQFGGAVAEELPGVINFFGGDENKLRAQTEALQELQSIEKDLGILALKGLGGNDTERELRTAIETNVNRSNTEGANKRILANKAAAAQVSIERQAFDQQWIAANGSIGSPNQSGDTYTEAWRSFQRERYGELRNGYLRRFGVGDIGSDLNKPKANSFFSPRLNREVGEDELEREAKALGISVEDARKILAAPKGKSDGR